MRASLLAHGKTSDGLQTRRQGAKGNGKLLTSRDWEKKGRDVRQGFPMRYSDRNLARDVFQRRDALENEMNNIELTKQIPHLG